LEQCRKTGTFRDKDFPSSPDEWRNNFLKMNPIQWVDKIAPRPLLILHGEKDELIEVAHARSLYDRAAEPKQFVLVPGGEHRLRISEAAMGAALSWLKARQ
jgi:fermentation-respiration switch protein FrsA (DUF1100 family)